MWIILIDFRFDDVSVQKKYLMMNYFEILFYIFLIDDVSVQKKWNDKYPN